MSTRSLARFALPALLLFLSLTASSQEGAGRKYALLIGVNEYDKNELRSLDYSENDVSDLAEVLRQGGYNKVTLMMQKIGARQTRYLPLARNIRKELDGFLGGKTRNDTVIIAFAGHGIQFKKDEMPYFCPMDAQLTDKKTLIALGEVYKALEQSQAGVRLLLVDACRNKPQSAFSRARAEVDLESLTRPEGLQAPSGVAVFFSCGAGQKAYESPTLKHGVFFHFVIEGLKGKAASDKGVVSLGRLRTYVREKVYDYVWDEFAQKQMVASLGQDEGIVPLIRRPDLAEIHNNLGWALHAKGRPDEAIAAFRESIRLKPHLAVAWAGLGQALSEKGQPDEAIYAFRESIRLKPDYSESHAGLGRSLRAKGRFDEAIVEFQKSIDLKPDYSESHAGLGHALRAKGKIGEAIVAFRKAIALKPDFALAHAGLGQVLADQGRTDAAIAAFRKAIELEQVLAYENPSGPMARLALALGGLGQALSEKGRPHEAEYAFRRAIKLKPDLALAHAGLGQVLADQGRTDAAVTAFRKAIELEPKLYGAHAGLGQVLADTGRPDEAIAAFRKAIELEPKLYGAHASLGWALHVTGRTAEAIAELRRAIALKPDSGDVHCNLGMVLQQRGEFAESLVAFRRGHELGSRKPGWKRPSERWVNEAEELLRLDAELPKFLRQEVQPASPAEGVRLALVCLYKSLYAAATLFYADAFAKKPKLADDPASANRYNAARCAALAGSGRGGDAGKLNDHERARLRRQAVDWLRADLTLRTKQVAGNRPGERATVQQKLRHWQKDADLAGIRDPAALAKLPADERAGCEQLWADVAALLQKTQENSK